MSSMPHLSPAAEIVASPLELAPGAHGASTDARARSRNVVHASGGEERRTPDLWMAAVILLAGAILATYAMQECRGRLRHGENLVRGDGVFYFVYLTSVTLDGDLQFENDYDAMGSNWSQSPFLSHRTVTGHLPNLWPSGSAILWAPFYLAGRGITVTLSMLGARVRTDGYGPVEQIAVLIGTEIYVLVALVMLYFELLRWYPRAESALAVLGILTATFLFFYGTIEPFFSHAPSFFAVVLLLRLSLRPLHTRWRAAALGAVFGLLVSIRPDGLAMAPFPILGLWRATKHGPEPRVAKLIQLGVPAFFGMVVAMIPQMVVWTVLYGMPLDPRASMFLHPGYVPLVSLLYSSRNGLFSWSPILLPSFVGLIAMTRRDRAFGIAALTCLGVGTYVNAIAWDWWGGAGFGARRFTAYLPFFAAGLARCLEFLRDHPRFGSGLILSSFVLQNVLNAEVVRRLSFSKVDTISFEWLARERTLQLQRWIGSPETFPANQIFPRRYGVPAARFDEVWGTEMQFDLGGRMEFGAFERSRVLLKGWSDPATIDGRWICWMRENTASLLAQFGPSSAHPSPPWRLRLTLSPVPTPCSINGNCGPGVERRPSVQVSINGVLVSQRQMLNRFGFRTVLIPVNDPSVWVAGANQIQISVTGGPTPATCAELVSLIHSRPGAARRWGFNASSTAALETECEGRIFAPRAAVDRLEFVDPPANWIPARR